MPGKDVKVDQILNWVSSTNVLNKGEKMLKQKNNVSKLQQEKS